MGKKILIVDDEQGLLKVLSIAIKKEGFSPLEATSGQDALNLIKTESIDVIISDIKMPDYTGLDLLKEVKSRAPNTGFILLTAYASLDSAIIALRAGADDYLTKPFDLEELFIRLRMVLKKYDLQREAAYLRSLFIDDDKEIIGLNTGLSSITKKLQKASPTDASIILYGESGTGKELIAKLIHKWSKRSQKPLVTVNCATIPETLLESELFGHKKGAYTGADSDKEGFFKIADEGTIFLDEIGEISPLIQLKLLRALQEKEITPLGATSALKIDVRIIVATNKDLMKLVKQGKFREDLYYRINVVSIFIPSLGKRKEDIIPLAEYFVDRLSKKHGLKRKLSDSVKEYLKKREWKGNIRELENVLEKVVVLSGDENISLNDFEDETTLVKRFYGNTLDEIEKDAIEMTLKAMKYDKRKSAEVLGIDLSTLYRKLRKYGLSI